MPERIRYLLLGGGPASAQAAFAIRERDKEGRCVIVCGENYPPYDKPPLSKKYIVRDDFVPDDITSKADEFYPENNVELIIGKKALELDRYSKTVTLDDGQVLAYEKLLLATGSSPREPEFAGANVLRTIDDAEQIRDQFHSAKTAVCLGAGYIGMESAAALKTAGLEVTVVDRASYPWSRFAGEGIGSYLRKAFEERGVHIRMGETIARMDSGAVHLDSGENLSADLVVAGLGVNLNTDLASRAGLEVSEGVIVDEYLQTPDANVWAAGDIARYPDPATGKLWHAEHHLNAKWTGAHAGANMAGANEPYRKVAYFFSDMFDLHMILRGNPFVHSTQRLLGAYDSGEFVELRGDAEGKIVSGIAFSSSEPKLDGISDKLEELIRAKAALDSVTEAIFGEAIGVE